MARARRTKANPTLLIALACGASVKSAALKAGVSERTVYRRLADPRFQKQLANFQTETIQRATAMLTSLSAGAVNTLGALLDPSVPFAVMHKSACSILQLGAEQREKLELEQRLATLEQRLGEQTQT
jgi:hypothetical protein